MKRFLLLPALGFAATFALAGCNPSGVYAVGGAAGLNENPATPTPLPSPASGSGGVDIRWDANRESGVNSAGGGYRVYYSSTGSITAGTPFLDVAYAAGTTPATAQLTGLAAGTYTIRIVAYSAANPTGSAGTDTTVVVP
jgi:hypothetical protein